MNRNGWSDAQLMGAMANAVACFDKENHRRTRKNMVNAGFIQLGAGAFGAAYTRPDMQGYIIKVSDGSDAFAAYCYWAIANPMPCIPEYKFPMFSEPDTRELGDNCRQFMVMMPEYHYCAEELSNSRDYAKCQEVLWGWYDGGGDLGAKFHPESDLQVATLALYKFFGRDVGYDFHTGNLLWDGLTKRFVITDPICGGDTDSLVTRITGKSVVQKAKDWEQAELNLAASNARVWPRPAYADRVAPVQIDEGLRDHAKLDDKRAHTLREFGIPRVMKKVDFPTTGLIAKFDARSFVLPRIFGGAGPAGARINQLKARVPDALGHAAQWVRKNGINPQTAERLGNMAQEWDDERIRRFGGNVIGFALLPDINPIFEPFANMDKPVNIKHIHVPVDVLRTLRDNWKVMAQNKNQQAWIDPRRQDKFRMMDWR